MNDAILTRRYAQALELLTTYCALDSVAAQGRKTQETADWVTALLQETGFTARQLTIPNAPNYIYAELRGQSDFTLLLYNHYDVQPEDPIDLWASPPFEVSEREGKLFARGIADNKAEFIARITALRSLLDEQDQLPFTIKWIIEGEEEIGSPHFEALAETYRDLLQADAALWEGRGFSEAGHVQIGLGTRGLLYVQYDIQTLAVDAHSGNASSLPSAAWRLLNALSSLKGAQDRVAIPGFYDSVRPPTEPEVQALSDSLDPKQQAQVKSLFGIDAYKEGKNGLDAALQVYEPTANIAGLLSGYTGEGVKTVLPAKASAKMDFRLVPEQHPDDIFEKLTWHLTAQGFDDIQVTRLGSAEPVVTPFDHPLVGKLQQVSHEFTGQAAKITPLGAGTLPLIGPMRRIVGVSGVSASGNPVYYGSAAHSPNENIRIADLQRALAFNRHVFMRLGGSGANSRG
jgi:acetylornithine deacetylase/succinyl-diaminopimelate desuccinylase-like protein